MVVRVCVCQSVPVTSLRLFGLSVSKPYTFLRPDESLLGTSIPLLHGRGVSVTYVIIRKKKE